jgi:hypothetical protein
VCAHLIRLFVFIIIFYFIPFRVPTQELCFHRVCEIPLQLGVIGKYHTIFRDAFIPFLYRAYTPDMLFLPRRRLGKWTNHWCTCCKSKGHAIFLASILVGQVFLSGRRLCHLYMLSLKLMSVHLWYAFICKDRSVTFKRVSSGLHYA